MSIAKKLAGYRDYMVKQFYRIDPKSRGNRHAVFKNFSVNYEINLLKYEHNFNTAKKLAEYSD